MAQNGIASRWWDPEELSPAEKYDLLFKPDELEVVREVEHWYYEEAQRPIGERPDPHTHPEVTVGPAAAWELVQHGVYQDVHPDDWWGHCNGWASYAIAEVGSFPQRSIDVRFEGGAVVECTDDLTGCVTFRKADIEALMAEVWFNDAATFGGQRCDIRPENIERDELGRPLDAECRDLNPGTFHVVVTQLLGIGGEHLATGTVGHPPFVVDYTADWEVWNFPVVGFEVIDAQDLTEAEATELIGAEGETWPFNEAAERFVRVQMLYSMVSDDVGRVALSRRADNRDIAPVDVELAYVLELDADDRILGGEWVDDPSFAWGPNSMELHPDFVWIPTDHQGELERPNDLGGGSDNPHLAYGRVRMLLDCANDATTCAPETMGTTEPVDTGTPPEPEPEPDEEEEEAGSCACSGAPSGGASLALVLGLVAAARRRRVRPAPW